MIIKRYGMLFIVISALLIITGLFGEPDLGEANSQAGSNWTHSARTRQSSGLIIEIPIEGKQIALTFDDGPDETTEQILDVLAEHDVNATFFVLGENCALRPDTLKRMVAEGHEVGNHTYTHPRLASQNDAQILKQLRDTNQVISQIIGQAPIYFRPPGGTINERILNAAKQENLSVVLWTPEEDSKDWINPGEGTIIRNVLVNARPGRIVLMHDGGGKRDQTLYALPEIIKQLKAKGYELVTLSELIAHQTKTVTEQGSDSYERDEK